MVVNKELEILRTNRTEEKKTAYSCARLSAEGSPLVMPDW